MQRACQIGGQWNFHWFIGFIVPVVRQTLFEVHYNFANIPSKSTIECSIQTCCSPWIVYSFHRGKFVAFDSIHRKPHGNFVLRQEKRQLTSTWTFFRLISHFSTYSQSTTRKISTIKIPAFYSAIFAKRLHIQHVFWLWLCFGYVI